MGSDPVPAMVVDGNLRINGNPTLLGGGGAIHSNGNIDVSGNPCFDEYVSSSGSLSVGGSVTTGGCPGGSGSDTRPGEPIIPVPIINPADFAGSADFVLKNNSNIEDGLGNVLCSASCMSWDFDSGKNEWKTSGNVSAGTYYSEGSIIINNDLGSIGSPLSMSLFAEGYIQIPAKPSLTPAHTSGGTAYSMVTAHDLELNGDSSNTYEAGFFYTAHQLKINGNPTLRGQVMAKDLADTAYNGTNLATRSGGYMEISGNPTIIYDVAGALGPGGTDTNSWRECRGSDADNPCD